MDDETLMLVKRLRQLSSPWARTLGADIQLAALEAAARDAADAIEKLAADKPTTGG